MLSVSFYRNIPQRDSLALKGWLRICWGFLSSCLTSEDYVSFWDHFFPFPCLLVSSAYWADFCFRLHSYLLPPSKHCTQHFNTIIPKRIVFQFYAMIEFVIYWQCKLRHLKAIVASILVLSAETDGLWSLSLCRIYLLSQLVSIWLRWRVLFIHFPLWDPCLHLLSFTVWQQVYAIVLMRGTQWVFTHCPDVCNHKGHVWQILLESLLCDHLLLSLETVVSGEWFRV